MKWSIRRLCVPAIALLALSAVSLAEEKNVPAKPAAVEATKAPIDLTGHWNGTWRSNCDGHDGPIEACFRKIDDDHYCVHFDGRFWGLLPFQYDVVLTVTGRDGDKLTLSGSKNLGLLLGTFSYNATVTDTEFVASYCSKRDQGEFRMTRCSRCCE